MLPSYRTTPCTLASMLALLVALPALAQETDPAAPAKQPAEIEVRALANEGFLLSAGDDVVAIDAFVAESYVGYGALSGEALAALVENAYRDMRERLLAGAL